MRSRQVAILACYALAGLLLISAGATVVIVEDLRYGAFASVLAVLLVRLLVITIPDLIRSRDERTDPETDLN